MRFVVDTVGNIYDTGQFYRLFPSISFPDISVFLICLIILVFGLSVPITQRLIFTDPENFIVVTGVYVWMILAMLGPLYLMYILYGRTDQFTRFVQAMVGCFYFFGLGIFSIGTTYFEIAEKTAPLQIILPVILFLFGSFLIYLLYVWKTFSNAFVIGTGSSKYIELKIGFAILVMCSYVLYIAMDFNDFYYSSVREFHICETFALDEDVQNYKNLLCDQCKDVDPQTCSRDVQKSRRVLLAKYHPDNKRSVKEKGLCETAFASIENLRCVCPLQEASCLDSEKLDSLRVSQEEIQRDPQGVVFNRVTIGVVMAYLLSTMY
jgi:hypothetical protein